MIYDYKYAFNIYKYYLLYNNCFINTIYIYIYMIIKMKF